jgi:hypothetical protein
LSLLGLNNSNLEKSLSQPWATDNNVTKTGNVPVTDEYIFPAYLEVLNAYKYWLNELETNDRGFAALDIFKDLGRMIEGKDGKYASFRRESVKEPKSKSDLARLNGLLNIYTKGITFNNPSQKITKVLFEGTKEILTKDFAL